MAIFVEEFLYRGREPGAVDPPAWHLQLTSLSTDDFGQPIRSTRTLNMAQAEEAGWPLPDIIVAINAELLREVETARSRADELETRLAEVAGARGPAEAEDGAGEGLAGQGPSQ